MQLDGSISGWAAVVLGAALVAVNVHAARRYGWVPRREHLRDPNGLAYAAFWNFLSADKWTAEGVALHRRYLGFLARTAAGLGALWLVLDALT